MAINTDKNKIVAVTLDHELANWLAADASRDSRSMSKQIRYIILQYRQQQEKELQK